MSSRYIKGRNVNLLVDGEVIAASTNCSFSLTANTSDSASKSDEGNGMWDNPEFTFYDWSASNESFVVSIAHLQTLLRKVVVENATVFVTFQATETGICYAADAIITQLQLSAPNGDNVKLSLSFDGSSPLTVTGEQETTTITAARLRGKALMLAMQGEDGYYHTLMASTTHSLTISVQTADVSTKDNNDKSCHKQVTGKSISLNTENLLTVAPSADDVTGVHASKLIDDVMQGKTLKMSLGYYEDSIGASAGADGDWKTGEPLLVFGDFICTSLQINGANKENATYSAEFQGKAMPQIGEAL